MLLDIVKPGTASCRPESKVPAHPPAAGELGAYDANPADIRTTASRMNADCGYD